MIRKGMVYRLKYEEDKDMPFPHVKKLSPPPLVLALEEEGIRDDKEYSGIGDVYFLKMIMFFFF